MPNNNPPTYSERDRHSGDMCKFYARGNCKFGENCRNSHTAAAASPQRESRPSAANRGNRTTCKYYLEGSCKFGNECKNIHADPKSPKARQRASTSRQNQSSAGDLVKVTCAYESKDNKPYSFPRDILRECSWNDALYKFRNTFPPIKDKDVAKIRFEVKGRVGERAAWVGIPKDSDAFRDMIDIAEELRIQVWRSKFDVWE